MPEDSPDSPPRDNIRNLIYQLGHVLDERLLQYRRGTRYEHVWQSDTRVFVQATREKKTMSEIARALKVTRQAVQASVRRLRQLEVIGVESVPGNRRDKLVVVTPRGLHAQATAVRQLAAIEEEIAKALHPRELEDFRRSLQIILAAMNQLVDSQDLALPLGVKRPE